MAAPLIRRMGMITALLTCTLAAAIRFFGYVSMDSIWFVLPFEAGHGWAFALMYTSVALLGEEYASVGLQATVQGLANSAQQAGSFSAVLLWSAIVSRYGLHFGFVVATTVFGIASLPLIGSLMIFLRQGFWHMRLRTRRDHGEQRGGRMLSTSPGLRSDDPSHCSSSATPAAPSSSSTVDSVL